MLVRHSAKQTDCPGRYPYRPHPNNGGDAKLADRIHVPVILQIKNIEQSLH